MSDSPTTLALLTKGISNVDLIKKMCEMERLLRHLRASANCYVPSEKLAEIDRFLDQK